MELKRLHIPAGVRRRLNGVRWSLVDGVQRRIATPSKATAPDTAVSRMRLERILTANILPFWRRSTFIDEADGGYRLNHDVNGRWKGEAEKALITQARTVWFLSRLAGTPYGDDEDLDRAGHGYRFLVDRMWDSRHGGFFWAVSPEGEPTRPMKHVCAQAFGLYALAQYAGASGDREASKKADELFGLLERFAHDSEHGGYHEFFTPDWQPGPAGVRGYLGTSRTGRKSMNTHLHVMEALTAHAELNAEEIVRERLSELVDILGQRVFRAEYGSCSEEHLVDWTPVRRGPYDRASYGHDLENVWLLMQAQSALGAEGASLEATWRRLVESALRYGEDSVNGGFFESGPFGRRADYRPKTWWVQAEALVATHRMWHLTGEAQYGAAFGRTLDWIETSQVDWARGDWFRVVRRGQGEGDKADDWKSPYHNGRAMLECIETLDVMSDR